MRVSPDLMNISKVLWLAQVFLTLFPAWFLYSLFRQAQRSGYRERSALPFAAALFTWTAAGVINTLSAFSNHLPYWEPNPSTFYKVLDVVRVLLSTINTIFLTIGATRLDNFPARFHGDSLRRLSNRWWIAVGLFMLAADVLAYTLAGGLKDIQGLDMIFGFLALVPITIGLFKTFRRYDMGRMLTAAIIAALMCLEAALIYIAYTHHDSPEEVVFLTSILVTSKVAFMIVLVMAAAAWGQYYTSGTVEELRRGGAPQRVRHLLFEVIPGEDIEYARRQAYDAILSYWPDSPALLEAIKTEGPSSREVVAASRKPQMLSGLIEAGILNLSLSHVGDDITTELMSASARVGVNSNGQVRSQTR